MIKRFRILGKFLMENEQTLEFMMESSSTMRDGIQINLNRMMQIGRRFTIIADFFFGGGVPGLAVLGSFTLAQIVQISTDRFERFAAFLRDEIERERTQSGL
ncbi:hypothetical protein BDF21DRAFT_401816 [Thamnidium elegans]|nr:hypothetical protein BDF21DRAFT_401816 [Thamnidium elegans]